MKSQYQFSIRRIFVATAVAGGVLVLYPAGAPWAAGMTAIGFAGLVMLSKQIEIRRTAYSIAFAVFGAGIYGSHPGISSGFHRFGNRVLTRTPVPENWLIGAFVGWLVFTCGWHIVRFSTRTNNTSRENPEAEDG